MSAPRTGGAFNAPGPEGPGSSTQGLRTARAPLLDRRCSRTPRKRPPRTGGYQGNNMSTRDSARPETRSAWSVISPEHLGGASGAGRKVLEVGQELAADAVPS